MPNRMNRALRIVAVVVFGTMAACEGYPVTEITEDRPVLRMLISPGDALLPGGSVELSETRISNFDLTVPDAFDRATGDTYRYFPTCPCWGFTSAAALGADEDPRLPAIQQEGVEVVDFGGSGNFLYVLGPEYWEADFFDIWGGIGGMPASQQVWVGFARYGVQESGRLDQADMLLTGAVSGPDQLVLAGGTPGGSGARPADLFNTAAPYAAEANANPYVLGHVTTSAEGRAGIDVVLGSSTVGGTPVYYTAAEGFSAAKAPFGPNDNGTIGSAQYNYMVVWGADPLTNPNAPVLARVQLAADAEGTSLNVRNNAFAPFPAEQVDLGTFRDLPGGTAAFAAPGVLTFEFSALPALTTGTYAIYLRNATTGEYLLLDTFSSVGADSTITVTANAEDLGVDFGEFNEVVVSVESGQPGATPAAPFLTRTYLGTDFSLSGGALTLGDASVTPGSRFQIAGAGEAAFFGDSLLVSLNRLSPPPAGFHYQSYLVRFRGPTVEAQHRLHTIEFGGECATAGDASCVDSVGNGTDRIGEDEVPGGFQAFNTYVIVLEANGNPSLTPALVQVSENYLDKFGDFFEEPDQQ